MEVELKLDKLYAALQEVNDATSGAMCAGAKQSYKIERKIAKLEFAPVVAKIMKGERVGRKGHWCASYEEFNYKEWKTLGWESAYAFITSNITPNSYTFNPKLIHPKGVTEEL